MSNDPILDLERELLHAHRRRNEVPAEEVRAAQAVAEHPNEARSVRRPARTRRGRPSRLGALALIATLIVAGAAAAATIALTGQRSRPQNGALPHAFATFATGSVPATGYRVELVPDLVAGAAASWCTTFELVSNTRSGSFVTGDCGGRDGPYAAGGGASSLPPGDHWIVYAVLSPQVAAVRISGARRLLIPVTSHTLPYGWKIAVAIVPSTRSASQLRANGTHVRFSLPPTVTFLNARQQPIALESHPHRTSLAVRSVDPHNPPAGRCAIRSGPLSGLRAVSETILRAPLPRAVNTAESGYLSCASVELRYHGSPVIAAMLVDAQHPGRRPTPLPGTQPLPNNPRTFVGPGAEEVGFLQFGFSTTAALITQRVGNAWLVLQGPHSLQARQAILRSLHATP